MSFTIHPIIKDHLPVINGKCWDSTETQEKLLHTQTILGFAAWEDGVCVGQLHCYRIDPPEWDSALYPAYGRRDPKGWPLGWPLQVAKELNLAGPIWGHGCFHVGLKIGNKDSEEGYYRRGIGRGLCEASLRWAWEQKYSAVIAIGGSAWVPTYNVWMGCLPARVYQKLGFTVLKVEEQAWWNTGSPAVNEEYQKAVASGKTQEELGAKVMVKTYEK